MCIYCGTNNYRKIYQNHYGPIPKDVDGRTYEIHHIDGNHSNNEPSNLMSITVKEHYDIHYAQKDYGACLLISRAMAITPEEKSKLAEMYAQQRVKNGSHHFSKRSDGSSLADDLIKLGKHPAQTKWICSACGTNGHSKTNYTRWHKDGKCLLPIIKTDPSQYEWKCGHCSTTGKGKGNYSRWHKDAKCSTINGKECLVRNQL